MISAFASSEFDDIVAGVDVLLIFYQYSRFIIKNMGK